MNQTCPLSPTYTAMKIVDSVARRKRLSNRFDILEAVCEDLERKFPGKSLEVVLEQMHMETTSSILRIIDAYLSKSDESEGSPIVTEGALKLVSQVAAGLSNRMDILEAVCEDLESRWPPQTLEHRLAQMHLQTTDRILYVIDVYLAGRDRKFLA